MSGSHTRLGCLYCHKPLVRGERERPFEFAGRKYCNHRCATSHRREPATARVPPRDCRYCGKPLVRRPKETITVFKRRRNCIPHCREPKRTEKKAKANVTKKVKIPPRKPRVRNPSQVIVLRKPPPIRIDARVNAEAIAAYLTCHQVTRCPTAAIGVTTATISISDGRAIRQYHTELDEKWKKQPVKQRRKEFLK
jgi:hypothetical protein